MPNITVHLNAKLQPRDRHDLEDVLLARLEKMKINAEISGGGTLQNAKGEIESCDIELVLSECTDESLDIIMRSMKSMLAPIGSKLIVNLDETNSEVKTIPFGDHQGLGLYLNGKDLKPEIYEKYDPNFIYEEIERLLGDFMVGHIASYWEGEETAFYLYGKSFDDMYYRIKPLLDSYPLCQKCKVVRIA